MEFLQKRFFYQTKLTATPIRWVSLFEHPCFRNLKSVNQKREIWGKTPKSFYNLKSANQSRECGKKSHLGSGMFKLNQFNKAHTQGFVSILLLPFIALMMTAIIGFSSLSVGIKNITTAQSYCIKANLTGQKELGLLLTKIVLLNSRVLFFQKTRKVLEASLVTATALGLLNLIPVLKKNLNIVQQVQKTLIIKQKYLLANSLLVKRKTFKSLKNQFKKLNISNVKELTFYKKALALEKKKVGDKAYTYKPVPDFTIHQKSQFSWKMRPFFPLDNKWQLLRQTKQKDFSSYKCTASLKKKGETWISALYH